jgi:phosphonate transport system substrate-binding protein
MKTRLVINSYLYKKTQSTFLYIICISSVFIFLSCNQISSEKNGEYQPTFDNHKSINVQKKTYYVGIHPLHNPERLFEIFNPVISKIIDSNADYVLVASKDYSQYDNRIKNREFHFLLPNPYQTIQAIKVGYNVIGKMSDDHNFKGIFIVKKSSKYKNIKDLKNKTISFPAPTALAAAMMPQYYLARNGLFENVNVHFKYVGSQESSILSVLHGEVDAAATWPPPWNSLKNERLEILNTLKVLDQTDHLINNSLMARDDVVKYSQNRFLESFLNLSQSEEGKEILNKMGLSRFESANNNTYRPVTLFLKKYEKLFGRKIND